VIRVLEISATAAAGYAGALLAQMGIQVDRVVLDAAESPAADGALFLHHGKEQRAVASPRRATASDYALADYHIVLEDVGAAALHKLGWSWRGLHKDAGARVLVSLSPFGRKGAYSDLPGNDFLAQAASSVMHNTGYDGEAPQMLPGEAAYMIAGLHGATAALVALFEQRDKEKNPESPPHIDISAQEAFMQHGIRHVAEYAYSGTVPRRQQREPRGLHYRHTAMASDGWLYLLALREPWQDLAAFLGLGEFLDAQAMERGSPQPDWNELQDAFHTAVASKSKYEWMADAAELGWTFAPAEDPFAIAASDQIAARGGMTQISDPESGDSLPIPPLPWTVRREL